MIRKIAEVGPKAGGKTAGDQTSVAVLFDQGQWQTVFDQLQTRDAEVGLGADALQALATAAYMLERDTEFITYMERACAQYQFDAEALRAARAAFWIGMTLMMRGEFGQGGGWMARAERLVDEHGATCAEQGYLLLPQVESHLAEGDLTAGESKALQAARLGDHFGDDDLRAIAWHLLGRISLQAGKFREGLARLDETMVAAMQGRLSPIVTGLLYCSVIEACQIHQIFERAKEWTDALSDWCQKQPQIIAFSGRCLIHRSEVMVFDGRWRDAIDEADKACTRLLSGSAQHYAGPAYYQQGEVQRLRGDFAEAAESYQAADRLGCSPQPGLALMQLQQGRVPLALSSIERALATAVEPPVRARLIPPAIDILLAADRLASAEALCAEFLAFAETTGAEAVHASLAEIQAELFRAHGEARQALPLYGKAFVIWRELQAPYRLAWLRLKTGQICVTLGDVEGARHDLQAAHDGFEQLGALPDQKFAASLLNALDHPKGNVLTARQSEVLQLVAHGLTNRQIAENLGLSERTIDRHVSDILDRIDAPTRTAATAYAMANRLISFAGNG